MLSRHSESPPRPVDIGAHLQGLERRLAATLGQRVSLQLDVARELGTATIEPAALERIIASIALNARESMCERGTLRIQANVIDLASDASSRAVAALPPGSYIEIAIVDDGAGIATDLLDRIFDPVVPNDGCVGTGLALATCWNTVERAGGTILVESEPHVGTTFRVLLPRRTAAARPEPSEPPRLERAAGQARVLVVDDERAIRQAVIRQLESNGHECEAATDGADALTKLRAQPDIELVISDVLMPKMGGLELAHHIESERPGVPVLLMSGYSPEEPALTQARRWPLLTKPQLLQAVDCMLSRHRFEPTPKSAETSSTAKAEPKRP